MKHKAKIDKKNINYDKLNALNMLNKDLGDAYLDMKWDPLGPNFKLDLPYIEKYLQNARDKSDIKTPEFIDKGTREAKKAFKNALQHNIQLRTEIQNKYDLGEYALYNNVNIEEQVKDILFFLNCREQMLQIALGKLKGKNINTLQAYKNIYSINKALSALLEETYQVEYNHKVAINNMLLLAQQERLNQIKHENEQAQNLQQTQNNTFTRKPRRMIKTANQTLNFIQSIANTVVKTVENIITQ